MLQTLTPHNQDDGDLVHRIGHDLLGPIVQRWLLGLHQHISFYDDGDTAFLFCARAGVRIEKLYNHFLDGFGAPASPGAMFWVSRVSACKGTFNRAKKLSTALIAREYQHSPMSDLVKGILRHQPKLLSTIDLAGAAYKVKGATFGEWIDGATPGAREVRRYLDRSSADFGSYVASLLAGKKRAVLVDSGWQGSMQSLLAKAFPDISWRGLYFGRSLLPGHDASIVNQVLGIMFEGQTYIPSRPETAFVRHRHIVESLLEPNGPSIEEVPGGAFAAAANDLIQANQSEAPSKQDDPLYLAVVDYLTGAGRTASITDILSRHQAAMAELARLIVTPTREEARALYCKDRSADFGKKFRVPVLHDPTTEESADSRIAKALWQEGQVALEFEGGFARDTQLRLAGCADAASYFDPAEEAASAKGNHNSVAIITRTKNRPLLLERAARSVAGQTYTNFVWTIVNDGGDEDVVRKVIEQCAVDRRKIQLVSNAKSLGMEAASNAGIANSQSDLIVIHDDDDSWEPAFLEKAVEFLSSKAKRKYGGVITHTTYISEEIRGSDVIEHHRTPYMDWVRNVPLVEMAASNMFAPIAFVFRRSIWEDIGGYNEDLPVLGDWFFNLEFLLRSDIGVIPVPLANYHHRDRGEASAYANSVIGGLSKHEEYAAVARNSFIRKNAEKFPGAVAAVVGYFAGDIRRANAPINTDEVVAGALYELADKYWSIAYLNKPSKSIELPFQRNRRKFIDPNISWPELMQIARRTRAFIPVPPSFDEHEYLGRHPDVAKAVEAGLFSSGYSHYILHGRSEGRLRPSIG